MKLRFAYVCLFVCVLTGLYTTPLWAQVTFQDATDLLNQPELSQDAVLGASLVDVNHDGHLDIFRAGALYLNQDGAQWVNSLVATDIQASTEFTHGATWADVNGDGLLDGLVLGLRGSPATLYLNLGNGRFEPVSGFQPSGLGGVWGDFDNDGTLDLLMTSEGQVMLHTNDGDAQFSSRTIASGESVPRFMCGAAAADYDRDDDLDVFLMGCDLRADRFGAIPLMQNALLRNDGGGAFTEVANQAGLLNEIGGLNQNETKSAVWFDYNNDGWPDLYELSDRGRGSFFNVGSSRLFRNNRDGTFTNITEEAGLGGVAPDRAGGLVAGDFDNDGWQDLYVGLLQGQPDYFYHNRGDGTFSAIDVSIATHNPTALATADMNDDGWLDLFSGFSFGDRLWLSEGNDNRWLKVKARSKSVNRLGVGVRVEVVVGEHRYTRIIKTAHGGASQSNNLTAHFGLGQAVSIDSVVVYWPGGVVDRIVDVAVDQELTIAEGEGVNTPPIVVPATPQDNGRVDIQEESIVFAWRSTDSDGDNLRYTFSLRGPGLDSTFQQLSETELILPTSLLRVNEDYFWTVAATDGYSTRRSAIQKITFGEPPVPALQLVPFPLTKVHSGGLAIGDYDGDGDQDLVITGRTQSGLTTGVFRLDDVVLEQVIENETLFLNTKVYRSTPSSLPGTQDGGVAWADIDGDNDLEILLHGANSAGVPITRLFYKVEDVYVAGPQPPFPGLVHSHVAWEDYDNDGDMDVLLTGSTTNEPPYSPITQLYQNNGGVFTEIPTDIPGFFFSHVTWGDYDADGDSDVAIMGARAQGVYETRLFRNEGDGRFANVNVKFEGLGSGNADWGDYDADGDLDLLVTGSRLTPEFLMGRTIIYRNDGAEQFTPLNTELTGGILGSAKWGDYDMDGDLDLVVMGDSKLGREPRTQLYRNNEGRFLPDVGLFGFLNSDMLFTDYNDDKDTDIIMIGRDFEDKPALLFMVNCLVPEFLPDDLVGPNGGC